MLFGALFSGYVLLRAGSETWDTPWLTARPSGALWPSHWLRDIGLVIAALLAWRYHVGYSRADHRNRRRLLPLGASLMAGQVVLNWLSESWALRRAEHGPATSVGAGSWFVLTGTVALLVVAGLIATAWMGWQHRGGVAPPHVARQIERYWWVMVGFEASLLVGVYLV